MSLPRSPANLVCLIMGVVFILVAIWGFIAGDRVLIFHVNTAHNLVHLLSGAASIACGLASLAVARGFCFVFGAVYGLVAVLGFLGVQWVVDLLHLNNADNWLHVVIALVYLAGGLLAHQSLPAGGPPTKPAVT
jgi:hypothetical protein